jgi:small subunit ribosomal protein S9
MPEKKTTTKVTKVTKQAVEESKAIAKDEKYITTIGRRKTATAQIRLFQKGTGKIIVNDTKLEDYFSAAQIDLIHKPLELVGVKYDFSIMLKGGGKQGQAEAIQNGFSKGLLKVNPEWRAIFKAEGWLTRDARKKERKKPGLKKARRAPQWSKR